MNDQRNLQMEFRILSDTRGRLRVRILGKPRERRREVERFAHSLADSKHVADFRANSSTGSVTLFYDPDATKSEDVIGLLRDAGFTAERTNGASVRLEPAAVSDSALTIVDAVTDLDARLSKLMGRRIDLKAAIPFTFIALGIFKTATQGVGWRQMPAYQLFWYAYATFRELNVELAVKELTRETIGNGKPG